MSSVDAVDDIAHRWRCSVGGVPVAVDVGGGANVVPEEARECVGGSSVHVCCDIVHEHIVAVDIVSLIASAGCTDHRIRKARVAKVVPLDMQLKAPDTRKGGSASRVQADE